MKTNRPPKVKITKQGLAENTYRNGDNVYSASGLVQYCKEKKYPVFDLPLAGIDLGQEPWSNTATIKDLARHIKRVFNANLEYPIILDDTGYICDGWHRVVKAIVLGIPTIKAIRIQEMPQEDGKQ